MKLTGKNGKLRIYDGSKILHGEAPLASRTIDVVKFDGITTYSNITSDVSTDDASFAAAFIADNDDAVFIGSTSKFAMVKFLRGAGANFADGSGALIASYYNGSNFDTVLAGVEDGTESGGDCFAQDGNISFKIPANWAMGGLAALDSNKYYIKLMTATSATTDPDADVLCPVDAQYFEIAFSGMDFSAPAGRAKTEEILVLNRNKSDSNAHYIEGADNTIFEPVELSNSCLLDDTVNNPELFLALECDDVGSTYWTETGTTTKGLSKNDGTNLNPSFQDSTKKTVTIQMLFEGSSKKYGWAYYETFFPKENQKVNEAEDGVTLAMAGGCYGVIEKITDFGSRY